MNNKDLPMFPVTSTTQFIDGNGNPYMEQKTIGGNTKFENAVVTIAQGLAMSGVIGIDDIGRYSIQIAKDIFDGIEKEPQ